MRSISSVVFYLAALFSNGALATTVADGSKVCGRLSPLEKSQCYEFMQKCESQFLKPTDQRYGPGSSSDSEIDQTYSNAGVQVSQTQGYSPNIETARGVCDSQLPSRSHDADSLNDLDTTCAKTKGVNNKVSCNDFPVQDDASGSKSGICEYVQSKYSIISQKYANEQSTCANATQKIDRAVTADAQ